MDVPPCVFDVYVTVHLDAQSLRALAITCRHSARCVHGNDGQEARDVFCIARKEVLTHPVNVLVLTDTTGEIRRQIGVSWATVSADPFILAWRLRTLQLVCRIDLSYTRVRSVDALIVCTSLRELNITGSMVKSADALSDRMPSLHVIDRPYVRPHPLAPHRLRGRFHFR